MSNDLDCPYAPRHRPSLHGQCEWCRQPVPEPWYMRRRNGPADAVAQIAANHRVHLSPHVAQEIAEAMLGYADAAIEIRQELPRQAWAERGAPYERVQLILAVQVRTPPIDRAAAVQAGVL